jgi:hypothetical protein
MEAPHVYVVHYNGDDVECYGNLEDDSNFHLVCEDEEEDQVWCDAGPNGDPFSSWEQVVEYLSQQVDSAIIEISAV